MSIKKIVPVILLASLLLGACAQLPGNPQVTPQPTPVEPQVTPSQPQPTPDPSAPAVQAVIQMLSAQLGISPEQISVVSVEKMEWPDGCLGLPKPGEVCTLAIVPGYRVVVSALGVDYIFRSDLEGKQVRQELSGQSPEPTPAGTPGPVIGGLYTIPVSVAIEQLRGFLQDANVKIDVVSSEHVDWRDSCLELGGPADSCAAVITPGWKILLSANGNTYEFHTDEKASVVRMKPVESSSVVNPPAVLPAAVKAAMQELSASLGISIDQIQVVSYEHKDWPDACLGITKPAMACATVITPGWLVILSANGQNYEYHTNETGTVVRLQQ